MWESRIVSLLLLLLFPIPVDRLIALVLAMASQRYLSVSLALGCALDPASIDISLQYRSNTYPVSLLLLHANVQCISFPNELGTCSLNHIRYPTEVCHRNPYLMVWRSLNEWLSLPMRWRWLSRRPCSFLAWFVSWYVNHGRYCDRTENEHVCHHSDHTIFSRTCGTRSVTFSSREYHLITFLERFSCECLITDDLDM